MLGDRQSVQQPCDEVPALVESRFIPQRYEPNYAYPLLVLLHGRGGDENQLIRSLPALSWRNHVGLGLRGIETIERKGHPLGFGWGREFARPRPWDRPATPRSDQTAKVFEQYLSGRQVDPVDRIQDGLFAAVRGVRRSLHVHSERIFLVGVGEGAAVAYTMGLRHPERFAGVVAINGWLPVGAMRAPVRLDACRDLKVLVIHGAWNRRASLDHARRDVGVLRAAGVKVAFQTYPCTHRLTRRMLSDVDSWVIHQCTAEQ